MPRTLLRVHRICTERSGKSSGGDRGRALGEAGEVTAGGPGGRRDAACRGSRPARHARDRRAGHAVACWVISNGDRSGRVTRLIYARHGDARCLPPGPAPSSPAARPRRRHADEAEMDDTGVPWLPRLGGRAPLGAGLERVARSGRWDRSRYPGRSEARMAVLGAAAARGWRLAEVQAAIACGAWTGLAGLYERRSEPGHGQRLQHDRVRHQEPGPVLGAEPPDSVPCPADASPHPDRGYSPPTIQALAHQGLIRIIRL